MFCWADSESRDCLSLWRIWKFEPRPVLKCGSDLKNAVLTGAKDLFFPVLTFEIEDNYLNSYFSREVRF